MLERSSFDYAVVRVVPSPEREEFFNAGVIVFCPQRKFLGSRVRLDREKLRAIAPKVDADEIDARLAAIPRVCAGDVDAGPIAQLPLRARFHWLVSPRSTVIQVSAVHSGICDEPRTLLDRLFREQVSAARL